jgi:protoporphyrinogen/coproporphyrinogen III oxidase
VLAIIGGGIAGLAAAFELTRRRVPFALFEASDRVGGLVRTEQVDGFTIEAGADSMLVQKPAALELCAELGLADRLIAPKARTAFVLHRGRLHALPSPSVLGIPSTWAQLARYALLPRLARMRMAIEPVLPARTTDRDESVASFFGRRFGATATELIAQPLLGGIHAGDIERLSLPSLFPRLAEAEGSPGRVLRWVQRTAAGSDRSGPFRSLNSGMGELVDAISRLLPQGAVRCALPVTALCRSDQGWSLTTANGTETFRGVVFACPAHVARDLLLDVDARASEICGAIRYVSTVSVGLGWAREAVRHTLDGSGFVVARASNRVRITACTWVSSKWGGRVPAGQVLLRAYIGGAHDPAAVELRDDELIEIAVRELSAILSITAPPSLARVHRWRAAGAQHEVGHQERIRELEMRVAAHPGLFVTGSGFRSIGIPDCVADARAVAGKAGVSCA